MVKSRVIRLESEDGQFQVAATDGADFFVTPLENSLIRVEDQQSPIDILTGSQWGPFRVEFQMLDAPPGDELVGEDVVELSVTTSTGLVISEVPPGRIVDLVVEPGDYRLRVSALGRSRARARDSARSERYQVQIWRASVADPLVVAGCDELEPPITRYNELPEYPAARAGSATIGIDIDGGVGARTLSGNRGEISVERVVHNRRSRAFATLSASVGFEYVPTGLVDDGVAWWYGRTPPGEREMPLTGQYGEIRLTPLDIAPPNRAVVRWEWVVPPHGMTRARHVDMVPFLSVAPIREVTVKRLSPEDGVPRSLVRITHSDLPAEWLEAMASYWEFHLAYSDSLAPLNR